MVFISFMIAGKLNLGFSPDHVGIRSNRKVCYLYPSYGLSSQTEVQEEKFSGWKKIGVYSFEFLGASVGHAFSLIPTLLAFNFFAEPGYWNFKSGIIAYSLSNALLTSAFTAGFGKILGEKGNWWHSAIGAGIGALIGGLMFYSVYFGSEQSSPCEEVISAGVLLIVPQLEVGPVIGFNLK